MIKEDLIILSSTNCPGCKALKKKIGDQIKVYDIQKSDDAVDLMMNKEILGVPTVMHKDNGKWNKCKVFFKDGKVIIRCNDKRFEFKEKE